MSSRIGKVILDYDALTVSREGIGQTLPQKEFYLLYKLLSYPIVSIRGFAKMLKLDDLTAEERNEYLDTIIIESERLSDLAANVLNLSKLEQQRILTDKNRFNVRLL